MTVRVRFAPSPTGSLHVGGARTALYNLLFARANGGKFILRVEDTDQARSTEAALAAQLQDLRWLGLDWDEGPYKQSQRLDIYKNIAQKLLQKGKAYYCFLTDDEIAEFRARKQVWHSPYRELDPEIALSRVAAGDKATIRFKASASEKIYSFKDLVRGPIDLNSTMVGDFVIMRSDGMPVYNFCCAIDDHLMQITHVFRGEEHLSNTLRQLMIYEAIDATSPEFGHLSIILGSDKKKLSKRQGAVSCDSFRAQGYLPEALVNYIALLGWSPKTEQEIFSLTELATVFKSEQLNAAAPIFDQKKLDWINSLHMRALDAKVLFARLEPFLSNQNYSKDTKWQTCVVEHLVTDASKLTDISESIKVYLDDYKWQKPLGFADLLAWDSTKLVWQEWHDWLQKTDVIDYNSVSEIMNAIKKGFDVKGKHLFMPLRVAVIGQMHGADVRVAAPLISKASLIERVAACLSSE